jgi:hypothetical protein
MSDLNWGRIPERMRGGISRYIDKGIPPGDFLTAVISNDLREACGRADDENRYLLWDYMVFFYNEAPSESWGSPEKMKAWVAMHAKVRAMLEQAPPPRPEPSVPFSKG